MGFKTHTQNGGQEDNVVTYHYFANSAQYWNKYAKNTKMTHQAMYEQGFKDMMAAQGQGKEQEPQKNSLLNAVREVLKQETTYKKFDQKPAQTTQKQ